jgi:hypothetical protein
LKSRVADVLLIEKEIFEQNLNCLNWGTLDLFFLKHESLKKQKTPKQKKSQRSLSFLKTKSPSHVKEQVR